MKSHSILIVDDIPKNLQVLGNILKENHFNVEFALDGKSAINWLKKKDFSLVLLDIMMPGMSGIEVCQKIRENEVYTDLPIIFLTAKADNESIIEGFKVGGQDYITKPFDSNELLARVNTHIELKEAKDQLKNMNSILEKKVEERTYELKEANKKLQKLDTAKTTFLNIISHEIRTPLNGILGSLSLIKDFGLTEKSMKFLTMLDRSAVRLEKFSYLTLDISLFSSGQERIISKEPSSLVQLFQLSIESYQRKLEEKELTIALNCNDSVSTKLDPKYIEKVNNYLVDNAVKFSNKNSKIEVNIWEEDDFVHLKIKDEGNGFADGFNIKDIVPFDSKNHVDQNPGLSLYLCRLIIEKHGGKIYNGNNTKKGAFVEYKLPKM